MKPGGRRRFLKFSLLGTLLSYLSKLGANPILPRVQKSAPDPLAALSAYLDTLIPQDLGPSASQLGVDKRIIEIAGSDTNYTKLLQAGCAWLDIEARKLGVDGFRYLKEDDQIAIVRSAEQANQPSLPWIFFGRTRADAFSNYYAHPDSWKAIAYTGPPQPLGYMDFESPPSIRADV